MSGSVPGCRGMRLHGAEVHEPRMLMLCLPLGTGAAAGGGGCGGCQPHQWHWVMAGLWGRLGTATDWSSVSVFSHGWYVVCFSLNLEEELGLREDF